MFTLSYLTSNSPDSQACIISTNLNNFIAFNIPEGFQKSCTEYSISLNRIKSLFITNTHSSSINGLPGCILTLYDSQIVNSTELIKYNTMHIIGNISLINHIYVLNKYLFNERKICFKLSYNYEPDVKPIQSKLNDKFNNFGYTNNSMENTTWKTSTSLSCIDCTISSNKYYKIDSIIIIPIHSSYGDNISYIIIAEIPGNINCSQLKKFGLKPGKKVQMLKEGISVESDYFFDDHSNRFDSSNRLFVNPSDVLDMKLPSVSLILDFDLLDQFYDILLLINNSLIEFSSQHNYSAVPNIETIYHFEHDSIIINHLNFILESLPLFQYKHIFGPNRSRKVHEVITIWTKCYELNFNLTTNCTISRSTSNLSNSVSKAFIFSENSVCKESLYHNNLIVLSHLGTANSSFNLMRYHLNSISPYLFPILLSEYELHSNKYSDISYHTVRFSLVNRSINSELISNLTYFNCIYCLSNCYKDELLKYTRTHTAITIPTLIPKFIVESPILSLIYTLYTDTITHSENYAKMSECANKALFLGTGASIPNKYRNVSSFIAFPSSFSLLIDVQLSEDIKEKIALSTDNLNSSELEVISYLSYYYVLHSNLAHQSAYRMFDCGEGSINQLFAFKWWLSHV